jgi:pyruvate,orthophosphate dikinase
MMIESSALKANLEATRQNDIPLTHNQNWFLDLSTDHWGVHKRTEDFFREFNHPFTDYAAVFDWLSQINQSDIWLYKDNPKGSEALSYIAQIYDQLYERDLAAEWKEKIYKGLFRFLSALDPEDVVSLAAVRVGLSVIDKVIMNDSSLAVTHVGLFRTYLNAWADHSDIGPEIIDRTRNLLRSSYDIWEAMMNTDSWFHENRPQFSTASQETIRWIGPDFFAGLKLRLVHASTWEQITSCLFFHDISSYLRRYSEKFVSPIERLYYLVFLIHIPGMSSLKNHIMYDMNRLLEKVLSKMTSTEVMGLVDNIFNHFKDVQNELAGTVLDCQNTIGKEIARKSDPQLVSYYTHKLVEFGFIVPGRVGINSDWQTVSSPYHVKNIRIWLDLISHSPHQHKELLAALVVNLKLGGIFISDTDLFQRDITNLLNSNIYPVFKQIKQVARIFPVFFNDIGAEGRLRDISTAIDESSKRMDRLVHFLRKQIHSESNNTHVQLVERIAEYWATGDTRYLAGWLPGDVFQSLDTSHDMYQGIHQLISELKSKLDVTTLELLHKPVLEIEHELRLCTAYAEREHDRLIDLITIYQLLRQKYSFDLDEITDLTAKASIFQPDEVVQFQSAYTQGDSHLAISILYGWMRRLKDVILSAEISQATETIYYKRHIAVGIPSMYGRYQEPKFDALGMMYRLEQVATRVMTERLGRFQLGFLTSMSLQQILDILADFQTGLSLDGIDNQSFNGNMDMLRYCLKTSGFTLDQFIDIFRFMAHSVKEIINEYFLRVYDETLTVVVQQVFGDHQHEQAKRIESFYREILSSAFLIQELDLFISRLVNELTYLAETHSADIIQDMLTLNPENLFSKLNIAEIDLDNQVFIGAKAYYLKRIRNLGFPIPPGFIITTELFRHRSSIFSQPMLVSQFEKEVFRLIHDLEDETGKVFGDPNNPLFLSVRSGTAISMPGAMTTFLNVGVNEAIALYQSDHAEQAWMVWDSYRRLVQSWGMSYGITRDEFDQIMLRFKERCQVNQKIQFSWEQMREIALAYREHLSKRQVRFHEDPYQQIIYAVKTVLQSWDAPRAKSYRSHLRIADEWGTAVMVQQMIMGNRSIHAGSGVVFTHDPRSNRPGIHLYGDYTMCSQGEDIVSGLVYPLPVSQRQNHGHSGYPSLEQKFPMIFAALQQYATQLVGDYGFNHQEIEFTFESDDPRDLYILQIRDQNIHAPETLSVFTTMPSIEELLGRGIGIHGGCLSGRVVFNESDLYWYRETHPDDKLILLRPDTVPDDIPLIFQCDGILTSRGGATSHAAVTAAKLGKVCIVNCRELMVSDTEGIARINNRILRSGDFIGIDGQNGEIYDGLFPLSRHSLPLISREDNMPIEDS